MTENNMNNEINGKVHAENTNEKKYAQKKEIDNEKLNLTEEDFDFKETSIWKNPYALAIIIIAMWFSLWLFINVFIGRWFS